MHLGQTQSCFAQIQLYSLPLILFIIPVVFRLNWEAMTQIIKLSLGQNPFLLGTKTVLRGTLGLEYKIHITKVLKLLSQHSMVQLQKLGIYVIRLLTMPIVLNLLSFNISFSIICLCSWTCAAVPGTLRCGLFGGGASSQTLCCSPRACSGSSV